MNIYEVGEQFNSKKREKEYERLLEDIDNNVEYFTKLGLMPLQSSSLNPSLFYSGTIISVFHSNAKIALQSRGLDCDLAKISGSFELKKGRLNQQGIIECIDAVVESYKIQNNKIDLVKKSHVALDSPRRNIFHIEVDKTFLLNSYEEYRIKELTR